MTLKSSGTMSSIVRDRLLQRIVSLANRGAITSSQQEYLNSLIGTTMEQNSNAVVENSQNSINSSSIGTVTSTVNTVTAKAPVLPHISNKGCIAATSNATSEAGVFKNNVTPRPPEVADAFLKH